MPAITWMSVPFADVRVGDTLLLHHTRQYYPLLYDRALLGVVTAVAAGVVTLRLGAEEEFRFGLLPDVVYDGGHTPSQGDDAVVLLAERDLAIVRLSAACGGSC